MQKQYLLCNLRGIFAAEDLALMIHGVVILWWDIPSETQEKLLLR